MISRHRHGVPVTFGFFVAQNAGCLSVALISETLHAANRLSSQHLIDISMFSHDGKPVQTTSRMTYPITGRVDEAGALDNVVLASSYDIPAAHIKRLIAAVRHHSSIIA